MSSIYGNIVFLQQIIVMIADASPVGKGYIDFVSFENQWVYMRNLNYYLFIAQSSSFYCGNTYFYHVSYTDHMFDVYGIFGKC